MDKIMFVFVPMYYIAFLKNFKNYINYILRGLLLFITDVWVLIRTHTPISIWSSVYNCIWQIQIEFIRYYLHFWQFRFSHSLRYLLLNFATIQHVNEMSKSVYFFGDNIIFFFAKFWVSYPTIRLRLSGRGQREFLQRCNTCQEWFEHPTPPQSIGSVREWIYTFAVPWNVGRRSFRWSMIMSRTHTYQKLKKLKLTRRCSGWIAKHHRRPLYQQTTFVYYSSRTRGTSNIRTLFVFHIRSEHTYLL